MAKDNETPVLSLCVPTYKRPDCVARLLENLATALPRTGLEDKVELCISDNNPGDEVKRLVDAANSGKQLRVRYHHWSENVGFDRNVQGALALATGEYAILNSDEVIHSGPALSELVAFLEKEKPDIVMLEPKRKTNAQPKASSVFRRFLSFSGVANYFGTNMDRFVFQRDAFASFLAVHDGKLDAYYGCLFLHVPLFLHALKHATTVHALALRLEDTAHGYLPRKPTVPLPSDRAKIYFVKYFETFSTAHARGVLSGPEFSGFKRSFLLNYPQLALRLRVYMIPEIFARDGKATLSMLERLDGEYGGLGRLWMRLARAVLFQGWIPYHWVADGWLWFKIRVRHDPKAVDITGAYRKGLEGFERHDLPKEQKKEQG